MPWCEFKQETIESWVSIKLSVQWDELYQVVEVLHSGGAHTVKDPFMSQKLMSGREN